MKNLLFTMSISFSFVMLCIATLLDFRIWSSFWRVVGVFFGTYAVGLVVSVIIVMTGMSKRENKAPMNTSTTASHTDGGRA
ncbi:hypothetical protein KAR48_00890 [bacterium]|nr:hypothetical protein [bacterium]